MINLKSGKNGEGKTEYYLNELDTYESFDRVVTEVIKSGPSLLDQVDGIYFRIALFSISGKKFKIIFHEDVGTYAFSIKEEENEDWLIKVLENLIENLNT